MVRQTAQHLRPSVSESSVHTIYSIPRERDIVTMKNIGQNLTLATSCMHISHVIWFVHL